MTEIKRAVIAAAGLSERLYPLTLACPKGLLKINDESLLGRSVKLLRQAGIEEIIVIVGDLRDMIMSALGDSCHYVHNPFYRHCSNMASLWMARNTVGGDGPFLYLHGDLIYDEKILQDELKNGAAEGLDLVVDIGPTDEEAMKVLVDDAGRFIKSSKDIPLDQALGEWIGMARIGPGTGDRLFHAIDHLLGQGELDAYDTAAFNVLARNGEKISIIPTDGKPWLEIDFAEDYGRAWQIFGHPLDKR